MELIFTIKFIKVNEKAYVIFIPYIERDEEVKPQIKFFIVYLHRCLLYEKIIPLYDTVGVLYGWAIHIPPKTPY